MKNTKLILASILIMTFSLVNLPIVLHAEETEKHNYKPKEGYAPDEETAIKIAVAVWIIIYGKEEIEREKPYKATLKDGIWYVMGYLPEGRKGGVAEAEISKDDGCIIRMSHGE